VRQITVSRAEKSEGIPIGELSRLTGVNIETIRYYEKIKMLQAPPRTEGGHRVYGPTETRALAFIRRARELGFRLDEIRTLLDLGGPGKASCADVRNVAARHLDDIRAKIGDLKKLERLLAKTIAQCSGKKVPDCPVLDILDISVPAPQRLP
jgi:MerR family transcriptional regulator, mercuric resistance operon regulatory protein